MNQALLLASIYKTHKHCNYLQTTLKLKLSTKFIQNAKQKLGLKVLSREGWGGGSARA
jgi:hypothetical protein